MTILLGQAGPGVDGANSNGAGTAYAQRLQASGTGTVTRVACKFATSSGVTSIHAAVYADNAGALTGATRLSEDFVFSGAPTAGFQIFTLATPANVTSGSFYWIEFIGIGSPINYTNFAATGGTEFDTVTTTCANPHITQGAGNANIANVWGDDFGAVAAPMIRTFNPIPFM